MRREDGHASIETALTLGSIVLPSVLGLVMVAQAVWTWGGVIHLTRLGALYAATHCVQDSAGSNVINYMQTHVPPIVDPRQIINGPAQIQVQYWTQDGVNHQTIPFECSASCSTECAPDAVTVTVTGYQFASLTRALGLPPIPMPAFSTTMQVESAGGNPDAGTTEAIP